MLGTDLSLSVGRPSTANGIPSSGGGGAFTNTYAVEFDGTDEFMTTGYTFAGSTFSASMWVKPTLGGANRWIGDSTTGLTGMRLDFGNKGTNWFVRLGAGQSTRKTVSAAAVNDGAWHHMVLTINGTSVKIYVDGSTTGGDVWTAGSPLSAGSNTVMVGRGTGLYDGLMDEVAFWDVELSSSDVTTLYSGGAVSDISSVGNSGAGPFAFWRMGDNDGGTGTTITNLGSGGSTNNGSFPNGITFESTDIPS